MSTTPNIDRIEQIKREERARLRALVQTLIDNDPNDLAADGGVTVLDVWRKEARRVLGIKE